MFDFQRLKIYEEAKIINKSIVLYIRRNTVLDPILRNRLETASVELINNIVRSTSSSLLKEKMDYCYDAKTNVYECVSSIEILYDESSISTEKFNFFMQKYENLLGMLEGYIQYIKESS